MKRKEKKKKRDKRKLAEEKRPLLLKINLSAKCKYPPSEPFPFKRSQPYPPPRNSPEKGKTKFFYDHNEQYIIEKLMLGEYSSLTEMAANINGGCKSRLVENILYKQMRKLLREDLKNLISKK